LAAPDFLLRAGGEAVTDSASEFRRDDVPLCLLVVCVDGVCDCSWVVFGEEMTLHSYLLVNLGVAATSFVISVPVNLVRWLKRRVKK
jgi:hypothetical protein